MHSSAFTLDNVLAAMGLSAQHISVGEAFSRHFNARALWTRTDAEIALLLASPYRNALLRQFIVDDYSMEQLCARMAVLGGEIVSVDQVLVMAKEIAETPPAELARMSLEARIVLALTRWRLGAGYEHIELCFCVRERVLGASGGDTQLRSYRVGVTLKQHGVAFRLIGGLVSYSALYKRKALDFNVVQRTRMLLFCMLQNAKPFDRVGYYVNQTPLLNMFVRPVTLDERSWLCSTLVATALQLCDVRYQGSVLDARRCTPYEVFAAVCRLDRDIGSYSMSYQSTGPNDPLVYRGTDAWRSDVILNL